MAVHVGSLSEELARFQRDEHRFGSSADANDMWLEIQSADSDFDLAILKFIHGILAKRYKPFSAARLDHCECMSR